MLTLGCVSNIEFVQVDAFASRFVRRSLLYELRTTTQNDVFWLTVMICPASKLLKTYDDFKAKCEFNKQTLEDLAVEEQNLKK